MRTSESILLFLNKFFPRKKVEGRESSLAYSETQYNWAKNSMQFYSDLVDLQGKDMLDAGCGPGGKTLFFSEQGVKSIIGVDIDPERIQYAKQFAEQKGATLPQFMVANLAALPFEDNRFDVIFLNDVVEHIERPILVKALHECKRVLRPGGRICLEFPPWTSFDAAHLYDHIHMPWCHVFFSDETLMNVIGRLAPNQATVSKLTYEEHYRELNKITIQEFRQMVRDLEFQVIRVEQIMLLKKQWMKHIPFFNRYLTRRVTAILSK